MGVFNITLNAGGPGAEPLTPVSAMVDTGAIHAMLPASLLNRLAVTPLDTIEYGLADGSRVAYDYGMARLGLNGQPERYCPVIFGPEREYLVGATTLEIFNLMVDPVDGNLIPRLHKARPV